MTHQSFALHPLLLLVALFVLPADSTARHVEPDGTYRVYCLFNPLDAGQVQRATALHEATLRWRQVEWVGIRLTAAMSAPIASIALDDMLANVDHLPAAVVRWLEIPDEPNSLGDRVLLEDTVTHRTYTGAGLDLRDMAAAILGPVIPALGSQALGSQALGNQALGNQALGNRTDVAVTTWGKVKELFR